jgi:HK97 gp10 family phage protein
MAGRVRIDGLRELEAALKELPKATGKGVLRRVLKDRAEPIAADARSKVRVDQGTLRDSIGVSTKLSRRQRGQHKKIGSKAAVEMFVGAGALTQAITEEFGTVDMSPHSFMRPAWDSNKSAILDGIADDLWAELRKAAARRAKKAARLAAKG